MGKGWLKRFFKSSWTVTIGGGLVLYLLISGITALTKNINIWKAIGTVARAIGNGVYAFLTFGVPVWVLLIVIGVGIPVLRLRRVLVRVTEEAERGSYRSYTKDIVRGWLFIWSWSKYGLINLTPVCKVCECALSENIIGRHFKGEEAHLYCPECGEKYPRVGGDISDIKKIVASRATTGRYKKSEFFGG